MFNIIYFPHHVIDPKPYFFPLFPTTTAKTCSGSLVLFGCGVKIGSDGTSPNWCKSAHSSSWSHQFIFNVLE